MGSALWDFTKRKLAVCYRRLNTTYRSRLQGKSRAITITWGRQIGPKRRQSALWNQLFMVRKTKKVKCTLVQELRLCTGCTAHRGTTALEGVRGQRHAPAAIYPLERPGTHYTRGWVGPRAGVDRCGNSRPPPGFAPWTVQPVASRYTDYATRPTLHSRKQHVKSPVSIILHSRKVTVQPCTGTEALYRPYGP